MKSTYITKCQTICQETQLVSSYYPQVGQKGLFEGFFRLTSLVTRVSDLASLPRRLELPDQGLRASNKWPKSNCFSPDSKRGLTLCQRSSQERLNVPSHQPASRRMHQSYHLSFHTFRHDHQSRSCMIGNLDQASSSISL